MIDVKVAGSALSAGAQQYFVNDATVVEDATSPALIDTFGGVGSVQVQTRLLDNTMLTQGANLEVTFKGAGKRTATIQSLDQSNGVTVSINGETKMARLRRKIRASVVKTTLGDALRQYFGKCGLKPSQYQIDPDIASRVVLLPGWHGDAWQKIKELAAVDQFEIGDVDGVVTVRPLGSLSLDIDFNSGYSESRKENIQGLYVATHLYQYTPINNDIVYPPGEYDSENGGTIPAGWRPESDIIEVTPGEPVEFEVPILASLTSVKQPVAVKLVPPDYDGTASVYTVVTNDGTQSVDPAVWKRLGGKVEVTILPDTQTLRIRVDAGRNVIDAAPYRLALTSGGGRDYSTLRIVGTGVTYTKSKLRLRTPVPRHLTDNEEASSTDSIFCRSQAQARRQLREQADAASMVVGSLSGDLPSVPNVFGERAGAIIKRPDANYRVRTATTSSLSTNIEADLHTTLADHEEVWGEMTIDEFDAVWEDYQIRAHDGAPLRTENPTAPEMPTMTGYGDGEFGSGGYGG